MKIDLNNKYVYERANNFFCLITYGNYLNLAYSKSIKQWIYAIT